MSLISARMINSGIFCKLEKSFPPKMLHTPLWYYQDIRMGLNGGKTTMYLFVWPETEEAQLMTRKSTLKWEYFEEDGATTLTTSEYIRWLNNIMCPRKTRVTLPTSTLIDRFVLTWFIPLGGLRVTPSSATQLKGLHEFADLEFNYRSIFYVT